MSTAELNKLKLNLIAWIHQLSDVDVLAFLEGLKNSGSKEDWWNKLTPEQQKLVLNGLNDADQDQLLSSDEFWKKLKNVEQM